MFSEGTHPSIDDNVTKEPRYIFINMGFYAAVGAVVGEICGGPEWAAVGAGAGALAGSMIGNLIGLPNQPCVQRPSNSVVPVAGHECT
jgi:hypothetical protein